MPTIPEHVRKFMSEYGVPQDEIWPLPGGRSYAIKHAALERIANKHAITFDPPHIVEADGANGVATLLVTARMGAAVTWTFGEASPKNNKNAYCFAMAEKRAKDRCVLKLLDTHGAIYSEDEADDFRQQASEPPPLSVVAAALITSLKMAQSVDDLTVWTEENNPKIRKLAENEKQAIRYAYASHRTQLAEAEYQKEAAE